MINERNELPPVHVLTQEGHALTCQQEGKRRPYYRQPSSLTNITLALFCLQQSTGAEIDVLLF